MHIELFELSDDTRTPVMTFKNSRELSEHFKLSIRTASDWATGRISSRKELKKYRFCPQHELKKERKAVEKYRKHIVLKERLSGLTKETLMDYIDTNFPRE